MVLKLQMQLLPNPYPSSVPGNHQSISVSKDSPILDILYKWTIQYVTFFFLASLS